MSPSDLINVCRELDGENLNNNIISHFAFKIQKNEIEDDNDLNLQFRTDIVDYLHEDFSQIDYPLIKCLFEEEIKCENEIWIHHNIYKLCYLIYALGNLDDVFILYDAKYFAKHMDMGIGLNREMLLMNHEAEEVIKHIKSRFLKDKMLEERYLEIIDELNDLKSEGYKPTEVKEFLRSYSPW